MHVLGSHIAITVNTQADLQNITRMGKRDVWRKKKAMVEVNTKSTACSKSGRDVHQAQPSHTSLHPAFRRTSRKKHSRSEPLQSGVEKAKRKAKADSIDLEDASS